MASLKYRVETFLRYPWSCPYRMIGNSTISKTKFPGSEFHFDLKSISDKPDFIQINGFQHLSVVAIKPAVVSLMGMPVISCTYLLAKKGQSNTLPIGQSDLRFTPDTNSGEPITISRPSSYDLRYSLLRVFGVMGKISIPFQKYKV